MEQKLQISHLLDHGICQADIDDKSTIKFNNLAMSIRKY